MSKRNEKELTDREVRSLLLEGMKEFKRVCGEHGLRYFLMYGTLLGATRHQGFIPWDDDVDVAMPREDYEKLIDLSSSGKLGARDWEVVTYKTHPGYDFPWGKFCNTKTLVTPSRFNTGFVYGLSIDIFIIDAVKGDTVEEAFENANAIRSEFERYKKQYRWTGVYHTGVKNAVKRFVKILYYRFMCLRHGSWTNVIRQEESKILAMAEAETKYVTYIFDNIKICIYDKLDFLGEPNQMLFEGEYFSVPTVPESFLNKRYGDYMTLPPEDQRVQVHTARITWK